jgi:hypothetical protein
LPKFASWISLKSFESDQSTPGTDHQGAVTPVLLLSTAKRLEKFNC